MNRSILLILSIIFVLHLISLVNAAGSLTSGLCMSSTSDEGIWFGINPDGRPFVNSTAMKFIPYADGITSTVSFSYCQGDSEMFSAMQCCCSQSYFTTSKGGLLCRTVGLYYFTVPIQVISIHTL